MVPSASSLWRGSAISSTSGPMSLAGQSRAIICSRASAGLGAARIRRIMSSMLATATARPTNTCARSRDLVSRCLVRRLTTSSRKAVNEEIMSLRLSCSGRPPLIASMLAPNERLQVGVAPELVQHHVGNGVALQLDDDAHALAVGFVPDVGDALDPLLAHLLGDLLDQRLLDDLVGNGGDDQRLAVLADLLGVHLGAHDDGAAALVIGRGDAGAAEDQRPGREVRARHDLVQLVDADLRVVEVGDAGVDHLAQVVRAGCWWPCRRRCRPSR